MYIPTSNAKLVLVQIGKVCNTYQCTKKVLWIWIWIRIILGSWIRIRIKVEAESGSGSASSE
jgi:hypothetical protein